MSGHLHCSAFRASRKRWWLALATAVGLPAAFLLFCAPPTETSFYPRCWFHALTGWHCPGCGTARCLHALLLGDLRQAAAYNLLLLLVLPVLIVCGLRGLFAALLGRKRRALRVPTWLILCFCIVLVVFGILRNLDFPPFNSLAPHDL
jgi:hypothetical protein